MGGEGEHVSLPLMSRGLLRRRKKKKKKNNKRKPGLSNGETSNCSTNRRKLGSMDKKNMDCCFDIHIIMAVKCALLETTKSSYVQRLIK